MKKILTRGTILIVVAAASGYAFAHFSDHRVPVEFFKGHTHFSGETQGAPAHSGGTNSMGCHNGSVPYHCH